MVEAVELPCQVASQRSRIVTVSAESAGSLAEAPDNLGRGFDTDRCEEHDRQPSVLKRRARDVFVRHGAREAVRGRLRCRRRRERGHAGTCGIAFQLAARRTGATARPRKSQPAAPSRRRGQGRNPAKPPEQNLEPLRAAEESSPGLRVRTTPVAEQSVCGMPAGCQAVALLDETLQSPSFTRPQHRFRASWLSGLGLRELAALAPPSAGIPVRDVRGWMEAGGLVCWECQRQKMFYFAGILRGAKRDSNQRPPA